MLIDELFELLPHERSRARIRPKPRGPYRKDRPVLGEPELLDYLVSHDIHTVSQLRAKRGKDDPMLHDYVIVFGAWSKAIEAAYGSQPEEIGPDATPEYLVKTLLEFNIWTRDRYLEVRKKHPEVICSYNQVRNIYGNFDNFKFAAEKQSAKINLNKYLALERRLGRQPTYVEVRRAGICWAPLKKVFKTKRELDKLFGLISNKPTSRKVSTKVFSDTDVEFDVFDRD